MIKSIESIKNKYEGRNNEILNILYKICNSKFDFNKSKCVENKTIINLRFVSINNLCLEFYLVLGFFENANIIVLGTIASPYGIDEGFELSKKQLEDELQNNDGFVYYKNYIKSFLSSEITESILSINQIIYRRYYKFKDRFSDYNYEFQTREKIIWPWLKSKIEIETKVYEPWIDDFESIKDL